METKGVMKNMETETIKKEAGETCKICGYHTENPFEMKQHRWGFHKIENPTKTPMVNIFMGLPLDNSNVSLIRDRIENIQEYMGREAWRMTENEYRYLKGQLSILYELIGEM